MTTTTHPSLGEIHVSALWVGTQVTGWDEGREVLAPAWGYVSEGERYHCTADEWERLSAGGVGYAAPDLLLLAACEEALAYLVASAPPVVAGESPERCALGALRLRLKSALATRSEP